VEGMIGTRVAFRGAFGPHEGIVLEETEDSGDGLCRYRRWKRAIRAPSGQVVPW
jgi:hypothetical protein